MDKEIIRLLKSSDPQDRMQGIRDLEYSGHPDTIKILGSLYKKETDPQVKKLASQTARRIKDSQASSPGYFDADPAPQVSASKKEEAKGYLERAMDCVIDLQLDEAWKWGRKAFQLDPSLANDDYALGVAAEITGTDQSIAVETLLGGSQVGMKSKPKRGEKSKFDRAYEDDRVGWGKALAGIGVYAALVSIVSALPFMIFAGAMATLVATFDPSSNDIAASTGSLALIAVGVAVAAFVGIFINIFIQYGLIHFSATTFLGGKGYFTNLLWNLKIPLIAQFIVQVVIVGIIIATLISALATIDQATLDAIGTTGDFTLIPGYQENVNMINGLSSLNSLIALGFTIWISMVIGNTYDFGGVKGCLAIIVSRIILVVAICGCYFAFIMMIVNAMPQSY